MRRAAPMVTIPTRTRGVTTHRPEWCCTIGTMGTSDTAAARVAATGTVVSIGYEGKTLSDLVALLLGQDVRMLVDVRLTPLSRRPGLSKTKLSEALAVVGIGYVHHRALGNPKDNRAGFRAGEPESRVRYREVLDSAAATDALAHVCEMLTAAWLRSCVSSTTTPSAIATSWCAGS